MRATEAFVLAACGAVLLCTLTATPQSPQLFTAPSLPVSSQVYEAQAAPGYVATSAPAFQIPAQPTEGQHNAAAFFAGATVLAAVCMRGRVAAAVEGQEELSAGVLSRRAMLAGLAASPVLAAAMPARAAKSIWAIRKGSIETPVSVKNKCNVEKACNKGAAFPFSGRSNKEAEGRFNAAMNKYKSRQPPEPEEGK